MPDQYQVRSRLIRVQAQRLETLPEAAEFELGWLFSCHAELREWSRIANCYNRRMSAQNGVRVIKEYGLE
jgi:hypothetical protein